MRISLIRRKGRLDYNKIPKYIHDTFRGIWKDCVGEFIYAALEPMVPHIDTGMSVASFQSVAAQVRLKSTLAAWMSGTNIRWGHKGLRAPFANNNADEKSTALGAALGRKAYILKFGPKEYRFQFKIVVFQYYLHESFENYDHSLNYDSLQKGQAAFIKRWNQLVQERLDPKRIGTMLIEAFLRE